MDVQEISPLSLDNYYKPIYPNSVNVLSASTNSGKSTLIVNLIKHRKNCFVRNFDRVVVVLCNEKVNANIYTDLNSEDLSVETCYLNEYTPEDILTANTVLIFEDINILTNVISESINVVCHHYDLNCVFLVTQSILKEEEFRHLLSLSHRIICFFSGIAANKIALYIKKFFFVNTEAKTYLNDIISYAEKNKSIVLIELNDINGPYQTKYFSIINFDTFFNQTKYRTFIIPKMSESNDYNATFSDYSTAVPDTSNFPPHSFLLVKAENVIQKSVDVKHKKKITSKEQEWNMVEDTLQEDIMTGIRFKNQQAALNIAKHILSCKDFIISSDAKTIKLKQNPRLSVSVLDYINAASRPAAPHEVFEPIFYKITKSLLLSKTPKFFIRNKNLFTIPKVKKKIKLDLN